MNYFPKLLFIIFISFLASNIILPQQGNIKFTHLDSFNGLSSSGVFAIVQDSTGYIWLGTQDGLNRYDGYEFKVFKNNPRDSTTISDDWVQTLFVDREDKLWIGTVSAGLNLFNPITEKFTRYMHNGKIKNCLSNNNVQAIAEDNEGSILIGTGYGLNILDKNTGKFTIYLHDPMNVNSISDNNIQTIFVDSSENIWIGTKRGGLNRFLPDKNIFTSYRHINGNGRSISSNNVKAICEDESGELWIGTADKGLDKFNYRKQEFKHYSFGRANNINRINDLLLDNDDNLWVGTEGEGLLKYDLKSKHYKIFYSDEGTNSKFNLSNNFVRSLFEDRAKTIWIGSFGGGVNKYNASRFKFGYYRTNSFNNDNNFISAFAKDGNYLWIGTLKDGLFRLDLQKNSYTNFKGNSSYPDAFNNRIRCITKDNDGNLWIGEASGIYIFNPNTCEIEHLVHKDNNSNSLNNNNVWAIYFEKERNIVWIGEFWGGLDKYDISKNKFTHFVYNKADETSISSNLVIAIYKDRRKRLWISTSRGLSLFNYESGKFERFYNDPQSENSISSNKINGVYEDSFGNLWIGTFGGGLDKYDESRNTFSSLTTFNSKIPSNVIYSILEDDEGNLWMSTNQGLSKYNITSGKFTNFDINDGLQNNEFNFGAALKDSAGNMYFGGISGFNIFNPNRIIVNQYKPSVIISGIKIFSKEPAAQVIYSFRKKKEIILLYNQNYISIEYRAFNFISPSKNQYRYIMEGLDKSWNNAGNREYVNYSNLSPGEYNFKVIASNDDGIWNYKGASFKIIISPPFWQTWWFISTVIFLLIVLAYMSHLFWVKYKIREALRIEKIHQEEEKKVRKQTAVDFHDELGLRLTRINLMAEVLKKNDKKSGINSDSLLDNIIENTRGLYDGIKDLVWSLDPKNDSLHSLFERLINFGQEVFSYSDIDFKVDKLPENFQKIILPTDWQRNLIFIFKELMNNAIKYSKATIVYLNTTLKNNVLVIAFSDNGCGFILEEISGKGNGIENILKRAKMIGGKLDINSIKDEGTKVTFTAEMQLNVPSKTYK